MVNIPLTIIKNEDWTYTVLSNIFNIVTQWDTLEEAIKNGKEALLCHIEGLTKSDEDYSIYKSLKSSINTFVTV